MVTRLLINEPPLQVLPTLAKYTGLNEAIFIQQLHYWLSNKKLGKTVDGRKWIFNSIAEWQQDNFPFWSDSAIKRIIRNLEGDKLVLSRKDLNKLKQDNTKWYTIDYEFLNSLHGPIHRIFTVSEKRKQARAERGAKVQSVLGQKYKVNQGKVQSVPTVTRDYPETTTKKKISKTEKKVLRDTSLTDKAPTNPTDPTKLKHVLKTKTEFTKQCKACKMIKDYASDGSGYVTKENTKRYFEIDGKKHTVTSKESTFCSGKPYTLFEESKPLTGKSFLQDGSLNQHNPVIEHVKTANFKQLKTLLYQLINYLSEGEFWTISENTSSLTVTCNSDTTVFFSIPPTPVKEDDLRKYLFFQLPFICDSEGLKPGYFLAVVNARNSDCSHAFMAGSECLICYETQPSPSQQERTSVHPQPESVPQESTPDSPYPTLTITLTPELLACFPQSNNKHSWGERKGEATCKKCSLGKMKIDSIETYFFVSGNSKVIINNVGKVPPCPRIHYDKKMRHLGQLNPLPGPPFKQDSRTADQQLVSKDYKYTECGVCGARFDSTSLSWPNCPGCENEKDYNDAKAKGLLSRFFQLLRFIATIAPKTLLFGKGNIGTGQIKVERIYNEIGLLLPSVNNLDNLFEVQINFFIATVSDELYEGDIQKVMDIIKSQPADCPHDIAHNLIVDGVCSACGERVVSQVIPPIHPPVEESPPGEADTFLGKYYQMLHLLMSRDYSVAGVHPATGSIVVKRTGRQDIHVPVKGNCEFRFLTRKNFEDLQHSLNDELGFFDLIKPFPTHCPHPWRVDGVCSACGERVVSQVIPTNPQESEGLSTPKGATLSPKSSPNQAQTNTTQLDTPEAATVPESAAILVVEELKKPSLPMMEDARYSGVEYPQNAPKTHMLVDTPVDYLVDTKGVQPKEPPKDFQLTKAKTRQGNGQKLNLDTSPINYAAKTINVPPDDFPEFEQGRTGDGNTFNPLKRVALTAEDVEAMAFGVKATGLSGQYPSEVAEAYKQLERGANGHKNAKTLFRGSEAQMRLGYAIATFWLVFQEYYPPPVTKNEWGAAMSGCKEHLDTLRLGIDGFKDGDLLDIYQKAYKAWKDGSEATTISRPQGINYIIGNVKAGLLSPKKSTAREMYVDNKDPQNYYNTYIKKGISKKVAINLARSQSGQRNWRPSNE